MTSRENDLYMRSCYASVEMLSGRGKPHTVTLLAITGF